MLKSKIKWVERERNRNSVRIGHAKQYITQSINIQIDIDRFFRRNRMKKSVSMDTSLFNLFFHWCFFLRLKNTVHIHFLMTSIINKGAALYISCRFRAHISILCITIGHLRVQTNSVLFIYNEIRIEFIPQSQCKWPNSFWLVQFNLRKHDICVEHFFSTSIFKNSL